MSTDTKEDNQADVKYQTKVLREIRSAVRSIDGRVNELMDEVRELADDQSGYSHWNGGYDSSGDYEIE